MITIDLVNCQAITEGHIEIQENSIVEFTGDNSNGKSVVSKIIKELTSGGLKDKETRLSLIKDGTDTAVALFTHNQEQLGIILKHETKDSCVIYIPDKDSEENKIIRAINDTQGVEAIVRKFGFRTYAQGDICLQLFPTWGPIPFITTSGAINYDIVQDITTDKIADEFLTTFESVTFPIFKERIKNLNREKEHAKTVLETMEAYDWKQYEAIAEKMREIYLKMANYDFLEIEEIPIPDVDIIPINSHSITEIPIVDFYDYVPYIKTTFIELDEYEQILNGKCPTCGKLLIED